MISPFMNEKLVEWAEKRWILRKLKNGARTFNNFGYAPYATDVTFQKFNCLSGNMQEAKKYLSGKYKL